MPGTTSSETISRPEHERFDSRNAPHNLALLN